MQDDLVQQAQEFVESAYGSRDDRAGVAHARGVGELLTELRCEHQIVVAGLLHDVVEDTAVTVGQIEQAFGPRVAGLVATLTEDQSIRDFRERKLALRTAIAEAGHTALVIFAADKLERVRAADRSATAIEPAKLEHYRRCSEMFAAHGARTPHAEELARRLMLRRGGRSRAGALTG
ncbi:MAG TPA: HD domain-containing protein [Baekduia sp.]|uniref:HD domain-containing protein n=1 Tax=Baekduia sp. TaxID=2600305 RepID=UPI002B6109E1|nr:HD domain-containing protein [Baekduia sp.]HMJ36361.1 HD domain-containing protein [Baekduia sp.]